MELLQIENLTFRYPGAEADALRGITLTVRQGEFLVLCGESGCGKTTLLRLLKRELAPAGKRGGEIRYRGRSLEALDARTSAAQIGFVLQNPDEQIVTDKVWHELAFGLENLGLPTGVIRRRVGEMASYFGIQDWFRRETDALSGGQKQLLNLASVLVMQPKLLLLDEPTAQLDPIAASEFLQTLYKLNRELGLTILLVEHRLEEAFPLADRAVLLEAGRVLDCDAPRRLGRALQTREHTHPMCCALPSAMRIAHALGAVEQSPLTVREGRDFLEARFAASAQAQPQTQPEIPPEPDDAAPAIELKNVWFRYEKELPDVLRGVTMAVRRGEFYCILGANGTGKTTALQVVAGLRRPYRGAVRIDGKPLKAYGGGALYRGKLALLPQNPQTLFLQDTVRADLDELLALRGVEKEAREAQVKAVAARVGVEPLLDRHPFDLSGGELQKCALAKLLLSAPEILLLDEPTKGLDAFAKQKLTALLRGLCDDGVTLLAVTHDVEFAAENADRCGLFFDGELLSDDRPQAFFAQNHFYTTAANRMARGLWPDAVTCAQVVARCREAKP